MLQPYIRAIPKSKEKLDETIIEKIILVCKDNSFLTSSERLRKSFLSRYNFSDYSAQTNYCLTTTKKCLFLLFQKRFPEIKIGQSTF